MQNAIQELEFTKVKSLIKANCCSPLGKELVDKIRPQKDLAKIRDRQILIFETREFFNSSNTLQLNDLKDTRELISQQKKHKIFSKEELLMLADNIFLTQQLKRNSTLKDERWQNLSKLIKSLPASPSLAEKFRKTFDAEGEIKQDATKKLKLIIQSHKQTKNNLYSSLEKILNKKQYAKVLADKIITKREGRYVITVKSEKKNVIKGIEHGRSQTGKSVYIEPLAVLDLNNKLHSLQDSKKEEIYQILTDLTLMVREKRHTLLDNLEILQKVDFLNAAATYFQHLPVSKPSLRSDFSLSLEKAVHPLLYKTLPRKKIIPFSLNLGKDFRALIISGVNTGGKTVTLKAVGLLSIMALSGLLVTAKKAVIGSFHSFYTDINDEQSLEDAISTFSSHVKKINNILHKADERSLILVDELGTGTNPEEGSALAQAILENLISLKSKVIVTTHLNKLKVFASEHDQCENASMRFDEKEMKPTYKLDIGFPGNSFALDIAREYKIPDSVLERAHALLDTKTLKLSYLLKKTEQQRNRLAQKIYNYDLKQKLLEDKIKTIEKKEKDWDKVEKNRRKQMLEREQEDFAHLKLKLDKKLKKLKSTQREKRIELDEIRELEEEIETQQKDISQSKEKILEEELESIDNPQKNDIIYIKSMDTIGKIDKISSNKIIVKSEGLNFSVAADDIYKVPQNKIANNSPEKTKDDNVSVFSDFDREIPFEINIMGLTFEEAKPVIEKYIDRAIVMDYKKIRILHGKGTGRLRRKIWDYLKDDGRLEDFYSPSSAEGGTGVTILVLK